MFGGRWTYGAAGECMCACVCVCVCGCVGVVGVCVFVSVSVLLQMAGERLRAVWERVRGRSPLPSLPPAYEEVVAGDERVGRLERELAESRESEAALVDELTRLHDQLREEREVRRRISRESEEQRQRLERRNSEFVEEMEEQRRGWAWEVSQLRMQVRQGEEGQREVVRLRAQLVEEKAGRERMAKELERL